MFARYRARSAQVEHIQGSTHFKSLYTSVGILVELSYGNTLTVTAHRGSRLAPE